MYNRSIIYTSYSAIFKPKLVKPNITDSLIIVSSERQDMVK